MQRSGLWIGLWIGMSAAACATAVAQPSTPTTGNGGQTSVQANPGLGLGGGALGPDRSRPVYLSGKVAMDDGSPPPPNVTIERYCGGVAKTVAYTSANGSFSFRWLDNSGIVADASQATSGAGSAHSNAHGFGGAQSAGGANILAVDPFGSRMMNCTLRASLAGYTSDEVKLFDRRTADDPDVGTIGLHRIAGVEGVSVSVTSMQAPKAAKAAFEKGLDALLKNKPADALKAFEKAVAIDQRYADAWVNLGKLRLASGAEASGREALEKAMAADPKLVGPYLELGMLAARHGAWVDVARYLDQAVALDPVDFPQAWYTDAAANYNLGRYDAAERSARAAVKLDPGNANPRSRYLLGLMLAEKKDYAAAAAELSAFIKLAPGAPDLEQAKARLSEVQKLEAAGK
jgi:tetratricopeptide (TPR) repeat protein